MTEAGRRIKERRQRVGALLREGRTLAEIARQLGVTDACVSTIQKQYYPELRNRRRVDHPGISSQAAQERREVIGVFLRETDFSLSEIAERTGISRERVRQVQQKYFWDSPRRWRGSRRRVLLTAEQLLARQQRTGTPAGQRDEMESRRLQAAQDLQAGLKQADVARKYGVSRTTVSRWGRTMNAKGIEALHKSVAPGRPCRLSRDQLAAVVEIYQAGPGAAGFDRPRWTMARFADAIFTQLGVRYDPDHVCRIARRLGLGERD